MYQIVICKKYEFLLLGKEGSNVHFKIPEIKHFCTYPLNKTKGNKNKKKGEKTNFELRGGSEQKSFPIQT